MSQTTEPVGSVLQKQMWEIPAAGSGYYYAEDTYSIGVYDSVIECSGTFTVTLPTAVGVDLKRYTIVNSGTGVITIDTTSSQTIMGASSVTVPAGKTYSVQSNGTEWITFADVGFSPSVVLNVTDSGSDVDSVPIGADGLYLVFYWIKPNGDGSNSYDFTVETLSSSILLGTIDMSKTDITSGMKIVDEAGSLVFSPSSDGTYSARIASIKLI